MPTTDVTGFTCAPDALAPRSLPLSSLDARLLLVIAHPDDETMFFSPLLSWTKRKRLSVHVLCFTRDGLRGQELINACSQVHGIPIKNVHFSESKSPHESISSTFPDTMDKMEGDWKGECVLEEIHRVVEDHNISTIVTFDADGVSHHVNHCAIFRALNTPEASSLLGCLCEVWVLRSQPLYLKYGLGLLTWLFLTLLHYDIPMKSKRRRFQIHHGEEILVEIPCISTLIAGMRCHVTQFVWFRWLWIVFSLYNCTNEFVRLIGNGDLVLPHHGLPDSEESRSISDDPSTPPSQVE